MNKVYVFGHQKPDTDSVTSSIAYAYLKNRLGVNAEERILGDINKETKFVLKYFNVKKPQYLDSVKLQLKDINYYRNYFINCDSSLNDTYNYLIDNCITGIPVVDDNKKLLGIVTIKDFIYNLKTRNNYLNTSYQHIIDILKGESKNKISDSIKGYIKVKDESVFIIDKEINTVITTKYSNNGYKLFNNINVICTNKSLVDVIRLLPWSNYVKDFISKDRIIKFSEDMYYDDFIKETNHLKFNNYPVIGKGDKCKGLIRITDINSKERKKVILVDHNELSQSVDGLEEAEIIEIIDHHKIGTSTNNPISFRNMTVGSTNTIIYQMYIENNIDIPYDIAGLMISGILSDTLGLTSSTTTDIDIRVVKDLEHILNLDYKEFFYKMLEAGTSIIGETIDDIVRQDLKYFQVGNIRYAISQMITLDINNIIKEKNKYLEVITEYKKNHNLELMIFIITDVIKKGSYLLYTDGIENMLKEIYHLDDVYEGVFIDNLTSRKKQVVPYVNEYLK